MKKRILMISFRCPWPEHKGGYILRVLNLAKILNERYTIDLLTLIKEDKERRSLNDLKKIFNKVFFVKHSLKDEFFGAFKFFLFSKPLQAGYYYSPKAYQWLKNNYQNYHLLYFNTIRTVEYARELKIPKVLDIIDAISLNYKLSEEWQDFLWKIIYKIEIPRTFEYEINIFKENMFDKLFISSGFDKKYLEENVSHSLEDLIVLPNGVKDSLLYEKKQGPENNFISFFGKMDYKSNEDAVIYFSQKVFPDIRKIFPELKFYIIGLNPTKRIINLNQKGGIKVTGFLENPYLLLRKSKLVVAPLRFGAGIQNKILESMALGKTVVTTEIGARGISGARNKKELLITDFKKPKEMARSIIDILNNEKEKDRIGERAKEFIFKNYTWDKIETILFSRIFDTIK